jgi:glycosyltransferase involved in cell wall biosynthesis
VAGRSGGEFVRADHGVADLRRVALPFRGEWDLATAYRLARTCQAESIDILHAHSSHAHTLALLARIIAGRAKVVVSRRVDFAPRANLFSRWKYRKPDATVAISDCIARVLRDFGIDESRLHTVHSCIDPQRLEAEPWPRSELGVAEDTPLLCNVAALVGHKDQATLIAAMPAVLEAFPNALLLVAGEGALRSDLEAQIAALSLGEHIRLLGYRRDVPSLLRAADCFVLSSKEEGLGTSVLDAMACGVPVVATAAGGIPEMVEHEVTGLLSPVGSPERLAAHLVRLLKDPALAQSLKAGGEALVQGRFAVDNMVEGNLAVYESLVDG